MRLDTLGKPPLVQPDNFERAKVVKLNIEPTKEATPPQESDSDPGHGGRAPPRLGKILSLLQKEEKKKKKKTETSEALKAYQRVSLTEISEQQVGQSLNIKV